MSTYFFISSYPYLTLPHYVANNGALLEPYYTHEDLRRDVVQYVQYWSTYSPVYQTLWESFAIGEGISLRELIRLQEEDGIYANELFVNATANYIRRPGSICSIL